MALAQPVRSSSAQHERPPIWRDVAVLKWIIQIATFVLVVTVFWVLADVAATNLSDKGFNVNYDWIDGPANIQLGEGIDTVPSSAGRALWVGMVNTLRIASVGIVVATILGVLVGLARLSHNWLANKAGSIFVETLRNIPVLVQIILWFAIIGSLGALRNADSPLGESGPIPGWLYVSQKGISLPRVFFADGFYQFLALMAVFGVGIHFVRRALIAKRDREGGRSLAGPVALGLTIVALIIAWFGNGIMSFLGDVFAALADAWGAIPQPVMQLVLTAIAVLAAADFIRRFLNSRRTPAGLAKLTDDDYFRLVFAGVLALLATFVIWVVWPGLSSWIINSGARLIRTSRRQVRWRQRYSPAGRHAPDHRDRPIQQLRGNRPDDVGELRRPVLRVGLLHRRLHRRDRSRRCDGGAQGTDRSGRRSGAQPGPVPA